MNRQISLFLTRPKASTGLVVIVVILALGIWRGPALASALAYNLAQVMLNKALWQEGGSAEERQASMRRAAELFEWTAYFRGENLSVPIETAPPAFESMIGALVAAEHYRRGGDLGAAQALRLGVDLPPAPGRQRALRIPGLVGPMPTGELVIWGDSPIWRVRSDVMIAASTETTNNRSGVFRFERHPDERNRAVFAWNYPFAIPYHQQLLFTTRVEPDCILQIETVVDRDMVRQPLNPNAERAARGTDEWEDYVIVVEGNVINFLYLILDLDENSDATACQMELQSLTLQETVLQETVLQETVLH